MQLAYLQYRPSLAEPFAVPPTAAVVGRVVAGSGLELRGFATLRADGEWVRIGVGAYFGERATVHIADGLLPTVIGDGVTVGRYALVHACTIDDGVVVADGAVVMDGAVVGAHALIAPGSLVPPRKQLPGGWIYQGNPAAPLREIARSELARVAAAIRAGNASPLGTWEDLPALDMRPFLPAGSGDGPLHARAGKRPEAGRAFVAPGAVIVGDVVIGDEAGVFFGCAVSAGGSRIVIGPRTNVQDNSILATDARRGPLHIGANVTIGHNVRMGSGVVEDEALIGMESKVGDGVVVERGACIAAGAWVDPGTVVKAGWIWAGRPAGAFRELKPAEREWFARGCEVYVEYARAYLAGTV